jgi:hypothetical protein
MENELNYDLLNEALAIQKSPALPPGCGFRW